MPNSAQTRPNHRQETTMKTPGYLGIDVGTSGLSVSFVD